MSLDQMISTAESIVKPAARSFNPFAYNKLIQPDNLPLHISFLVDRKRAGKFQTHWNSETNTHDLCDKMYGRECKKCKAGDKPTVVVDYLIYNYEKVDSRREAKSGTVYEENPYMVYSQRSGKQEINFNYLNELNGDQDQFYNLTKKNAKGAPELLADEMIKNELLFDIDSGNHKIFRIVKLVTEGKMDPKTGKKSKSVEYSSPAQVSRSALEKMLPEKKGKLLIPAEAKDKLIFGLTIHDVFPHYLAHYGNVDWDQWGVSPLDTDSISFGIQRRAEEGEKPKGNLSDANAAL